MAKEEAKKQEKKEESKAEEAPKVSKKPKARKRIVPLGNAYVNASYNNTLISLTEPNGNVIAWGSSGSSGFKGTRKSTPYAAQVAAEKSAEKGKLFGLEKIHVYVKGLGSGREQAVRGLVASGLDILSITDVTPVPHNGCRHRRPRKV